MIRKLAIAGSSLALAAAPALGLALPASASVQPIVGYTMFNSTCSSGGPCQERIQILGNQNNAATRAWIDCYSILGGFTRLYGGWHTAIGDTSTTPSCDSIGRSGEAGKQWNKTYLYTVTCWSRGGSWNGSC